MNTTYANVGDGTRHDISVELITHRELEFEEGRVTELTVADQAGEEFTALATPESDGLGELEEGSIYRLSGMLGAMPVRASVQSGAECPECAGDLRPGQVVDGVGRMIPEAAAQLELDQPFGIIDPRTAVHRVREEVDVVDDWDSMQYDRPVESPDYVCVSCGKHVAAYELREAKSHPDGNEEQVVQSVSSAPMNESMASPETVGLATGGAKDATNFRDNIENGYTPQPEAISDEGLFYDYYFDTGEGAVSDSLFSPRYAAGVSEHPLTGETEQYLSVGLDSTLSVEDFERPRLDLVAVLDVSGSMSSPFEAYYYDQQGNRQEAEADAATKMEAATRSLCALTEQLDDDDRLGVVLYNNQAHVAKPLRDVGSTDLPAIRRHIRDTQASKQRHRPGRRCGDGSHRRRRTTRGRCKRDAHRRGRFYPHKGKSDQFYFLVSLLDPYRFSNESQINPDALEDLMIRRLKDDMYETDGTRMFPEKNIEALPVEMTSEERKLYDDVTEYIRETALAAD